MLELPKKELLRVDEAALYFSVTDRCIRLWIEHGHLEAVKIVGSIRITRESALKCRFGTQKADKPAIEQEKAKPEPPVEAVPVKRGRPKARS